MDPCAGEIGDVGKLTEKTSGQQEFGFDLEMIGADKAVDAFPAGMDTDNIVDSDNVIVNDKSGEGEVEQVSKKSESEEKGADVVSQDEPMDTSEHQENKEINRNGDVNASESNESQETNDTPKVSENNELNDNSPALDSEQTTSNGSITQTGTQALLVTAAEEALTKSSTAMETQTSEVVDGNDDNKSESGSEEDCASDQEKSAEKMDKVAAQVEAEPEIEMEPVIEDIDEIDLQICSTEEAKACYVCKKTKLVKYSFQKKSGLEESDENKHQEYVCSDDCFKKLEPHCNKVNSPAYFDKKLHVVEENPIKHKRKCKQCSKDVNVQRGVCSWEAMDFCREHCLYRYQLKFTKKCSECDKKVEYHQLGKYSVRFGSIIRQFCSGTCLDQRKKKIRLCSYCQMAMASSAAPGITIGQKFFCTFKCRDQFVQLTAPNKPPYVPNKETTFCYICADSSKEITKEFSYQGASYYLCGEECLIVFKFLHNFNEKVGKCHNCWKHATLNQLEAFGMFYDGAFNHFCSTTCQYIHIITHRRIMPCVWCKVKKYNFDLIHRTGVLGDVIYSCSLNCLQQLTAALDKVCSKGKTCEQCAADKVSCEITISDGRVKTFCSTNCVAEFQSKLRKKESRNEPEPLPQISNVMSLAEQANERKVIFIQDELPPDIANKMCQVRIMSCEQGTQILTEKAEQECQTDFEEELRLRAVPVPIYVPQPIQMWNVPLPRAVPFPLPVPLPMLVPLTRDSSTEYLKTMKKEPVKTPRDPFEAELLMMAELVAAEKPKEEIEDPDEQVEDDFSPEPADAAFSDDMLQMALKMATDYHESAVDLEGALQANTITPGHHPMELTSSDEIIHTEPLTGVARGGPRGRGRGRGSRGPRGGTSRRPRGRPPAMPTVPMPEPTPPPPPEPVEKPDAHMCLKYTFGVNAWKQWVTTKNSDLERSSRKLKLFKTDLLQMTSDELNYSLCLFVNEVRKPNGSEYAPDTIYYLCLGVQQYLYECGRIDNIFCDSFYEKFTDCLDDVCGKFSTLYSDSHYIVTRVEEEHLWESKQLGAHSPFVLLTTLMFFNTKHFNLTSVEEHMQLSFSHIMKHWKRNPGQGGSRQMPAGGRNVLLRFYPPQNAQANTRKKKVYEQQENEDNPLRCPVKLYEFYLSKCPESVKTRNDVFYLLPERSCVPESPVWYSTMALDLRALNKMLHRVKMVKEINVALLTH